MKNEDVINIYWAPRSTYEDSDAGEWNMLYPEPTTLFSELHSKRLKDAGEDTFFSCPATNDKYRKTYVFKNELASSYEFDYTNEDPNLNYIKNLSKTYINYNVMRPPTISDGPMINISLYYSFFADQPLEAVFTPPMMHKPQYTQYGTCVPGQFDIGQWFRPYPMEMQMWNMKGELHIKSGEPLFYVEFKTDKKIKLHRYKMNGTIASYLYSGANSKAHWGPGFSLLERYKRFNQSRMNDLILMEIKKNLLD